jgi:hypothetical protein
MIDTVIEGTEEGGREITIEFFNLSKKEYARAWGLCIKLTIAMMKAKGLVEEDRDGLLHLTEAGRQ